MDSPEKLDADYEALISSASEAIAKSEPFKTITFLDGVPVVKPPSFWDRLTFWRR